MFSFWTHTQEQKLYSPLRLRRWWVATAPHCWPSWLNCESPTSPQLYAQWGSASCLDCCGRQRKSMALLEAAEFTGKEEHNKMALEMYCASGALRFFPWAESSSQALLNLHGS